MVAPIIGPTTKKEGFVGISEFSPFCQTRTLYSQQPPFNLALPYVRLTSRIQSFRSAGNVYAVDKYVGNASYNGTYDGAYMNFLTYASRFATSGTTEQLTVARAKNMVYEKVVSELGERVELLVTIAERRESYQMVEKRLVDLYRFIKALRHPNANQMRQFFTGSSLPRDFRETLKYHLRNWRASTKDLGRLWLELHFGWEPIVRDIDTSLRLASQPLPEAEVEVSSRRLPISTSYGMTRSNPYSRSRSNMAGSVKCYGNVAIQVDNPDEAYKTVLGLNNSVLVAYNLIPYTWMFDWVNYLGTYISSLSDLQGYKVTRASHSVITRVVGTFSYEYPKGTTRSNSWSGEQFERFVGLPSVTLTWRPLPKRLSVIRGATLASVIANLLDPSDPVWKVKRTT